MEPGVDAGDDVLEGHRSRYRRLSDRWLLTLVAAMAVVAAASIATAVHYRNSAAHAPRISPALVAAAARLRGSGPFTRSLTVANAAFPVGSGQHGLLAIVHGSAGTPRPVVVVAQFSGLRPGRRYVLVGNDCKSSSANVVWADGAASKAGSLLLATFPRALSPSDVYFLSLHGPGTRPAAGVAGELGAGRVAAFSAGHRPC
jgi:hypothetical protein